MIQAHDSVTGLRSLLEAIQADDSASKATVHRSYCSEGATGRTTLDFGEQLKQCIVCIQNTHLFHIVMVKAFEAEDSTSTAIDEDKAKILDLDDQNWQLGLRTYANFETQRVWVEWKLYRDTLVLLKYNETERIPTPCVQNNVERLDSLLKIILDRKSYAYRSTIKGGEGSGWESHTPWGKAQTLYVIHRHSWRLCQEHRLAYSFVFTLRKK
ncbi:hypothetical protein P154DRAFT_576749 [Amniculicola lignicola CBS 123094]|uniref:Uncharacterized protein n=1 Tax=Amniculicola lignicola CBS 123094 TaxID=1392246 RepID=A0A6A5WEN9_9PLEO|nr:hypothetical protein P154DRAFT_576749 [Amniculicola lignicola CBS 123094]